MPEYVEGKDFMSGKVAIVWNDQPYELLKIKKSGLDLKEIVFTFAPLATLTNMGDIDV